MIRELTATCKGKQMKNILSFTTFILLCAALTTRAAEPQPTTDETPIAPTKSLTLLAKDKHPDIDHVEIKGENPEVIYIPIVHDNPEHRHAGGNTRKAIEATLVSCQTISEHLHADYGVRNILLEGISKSLSDKYNSPKYRGRKLSVGKSKSLTYKVWFDLLNKNQWHLVPAKDKNLYGPLTLLGSQYTARIQNALRAAQQNGWFRSRQAFDANKDAFDKHIAEACKGYNEQLEGLLIADPGLKREYDITVTQRNKVFIDNTLAAKGPGIIMCGGGHIQNLTDQLEKRKISYMIIVPKGIQWPPAEKDEKTIYNDMLQLGCNLKTCDLRFGDGTSAKIQIPIK